MRRCNQLSGKQGTSRRQKRDHKNVYSSIVKADMFCVVENIFEDGSWAILEWRDPLGLRGYGFFNIKNEEILYQRGYWEKLTFLRQYNLPLPKE